MLQHSELEKALKLPNTVWGYFEWFTGIIRINIDAEGDNKEALHEIDKEEFDETYNHEVFHCCQICTTGFLYYYVAQFLKEIAPFWRKVTENGALSKMTVLELLESIISEPNAGIEKITSLFSFIDQVNQSSNISPRDIIEGQAYFFQKSITNPHLTHGKYLKLLDYAPASEYIKSYLMTTKYLDNLTFTRFNMISYISLLFLEPQIVFEELCLFFQENFRDGSYDSSILTRAINSSTFSSQYLGNSFEVTAKYIAAKELNPFYSSNILVMQQIAKQSKTNFLGLMSNPLNWFEDNLKYFNIPMILNPYYLGTGAKKSGISAFGESYSHSVHMILGFLCLIANNKGQHSAPRYMHLRKNSAGTDRY